MGKRISIYLSGDFYVFIIERSFWDLQLEAEQLELCIAQGQETPDTDADWLK